MKKYGKELEFISLLKRDGSGTIPVGTEWNAESNHAKTDCVKYMDDDEFTLSALSLSLQTFIASDFNTWVVRIKSEQP